jgi:hypothetical protein
MNIARSLVGIAAGAVALAAAMTPDVAHAAQPASGEDIKGKTVYMAAGARLRYSPSLAGRVYTRPKLPLELVGRGPCTNLFCPVKHNNVDLFASRLRLDTVKPSGPLLTDRTLRRGDEGEDVKVIQQALNKKGAKLEVDGKFGRSTEDAVKDVQRQSKVTADGVVGPETRRLLSV